MVSSITFLAMICDGDGNRDQAIELIIAMSVYLIKHVFCLSEEYTFWNLVTVPILQNSQLYLAKKIGPEIYYWFTSYYPAGLWNVSCWENRTWNSLLVYKSLSCRIINCVLTKKSKMKLIVGLLFIVLMDSELCLAKKIEPGNDCWFTSYYPAGFWIVAWRENRNWNYIFV